MNSIGKNIVLTLFGESHSETIGAVLDGMPCGIMVDERFIAESLAARRPSGVNETARVEKDEFKIASGVFNGYTTGEPICILISNSNVRSSDYGEMRFLARPSHADYVSHVVHKGFEDYRGGGHFSGRLTAPIVAAGAICRQLLESRGILVGTHILVCGKAEDKPFNSVQAVLDEEIRKVNGKKFPVIGDVEETMVAEIDAVRMNQDSIGGIIQTAISNLPVGVGEPWFGSVEDTIANAMFSVGGIKGVEFGAGFGFSNLTGRTGNDEFYNDNGVVKTYTNNNGGVNGGYSNGMPVVFNCAVKPTPSIAAPQRTVNMQSLENETLCIKGRHDPAIIRRICPVVTALTSIVVCDMLKTAGR
jgi:chorismate synthase